ncbi:hypothetical protein [Microbacterium sp. OR16]|uniref:hypothetical protein n=1 Tax=Microbacterium sp. OR16 TaxID=3095345 RepID=UPI0039B3D633
MTEQQPEYVWAYADEVPKRGRTWLIVGLAVAAVVIAALVFWLFLRPGAPLASATATPSATPSASVSPSASASATESATPSAAPSEAPEPSMTPVTTPPPPVDPSMDAFRGQVGGWLDDALTGLGIVEDSRGQEAVAVVDTLRADAQRLGERTAPSSIASDWQEGVRTYSERLSALRAAAAAGTSVSVDASRSSVEALRELVGL